MPVQTADLVKNPAKSRKIYAGDILACGFGITVAVWLVAYISRMPAVNAPAMVTVWAMVAAVFQGGILTGRYSPKGMWGAVAAGAVSGVLNILILGSLLFDVSKAEPVPAVMMVILPSILLNAVVAGLGGLLGRAIASPARSSIQWSSVFALVLLAATLPLITAGGLVTAFRYGLAVPDWPQSYGYNMFLFPLSKMQSNHGNFYEHAHRLMGSLVGLTALALAIYVTIADSRRWLKWWAWGLGFCIAIQAGMGGFRVTEKSVPLAMAHGVFAQIVFGAMAAFAAACSSTFARITPKACHDASTDRVFSGALVFLLCVQLVIGAIVRHTHEQVLLHIVVASVVALLCLACGFRAWGLHSEVTPLKRTGLLVLALVTVQLTLGVVALVFRVDANQDPTLQSAFLTTAHQANGALLLAASVTMWVWTIRALVAAKAVMGAQVPAEAIPEA